jgi:hypothetical protein
MQLVYIKGKREKRKKIIESYKILRIVQLNNSTINNLKSGQKRHLLKQQVKKKM